MSIFGKIDEIYDRWFMNSKWIGKLFDIGYLWKWYIYIYCLEFDNLSIYIVSLNVLYNNIKNKSEFHVFAKKEFFAILF